MHVLKMLKGFTHLATLSTISEKLVLQICFHIPEIIMDVIIWHYLSTTSTVFICIFTIITYLLLLCTY